MTKPYVELEFEFCRVLARFYKDTLDRNEELHYKTYYSLNKGKSKSKVIKKTAPLNIIPEDNFLPTYLSSLESSNALTKEIRIEVLYNHLKSFC